MSYLPWFMDLQFQVPMRYYSLQHQTALSPPDRSTIGHHFQFGPAYSFFLELLAIAFHSSSVAYWTASNLRGLSSGVTSFGLFILFMGCLRQECWSGLPFPPPVEYISVRTLHTTRPSWVALHGMAHSFIELPKPLYHNKPEIHEEDLLWHQCN